MLLHIIPWPNANKFCLTPTLTLTWQVMHLTRALTQRHTPRTHNAIVMYCICLSVCKGFNASFPATLAVVSSNMYYSSDHIILVHSTVWWSLLITCCMPMSRQLYRKTPHFYLPSSVKWYVHRKLPCASTGFKAGACHAVIPKGRKNNCNIRTKWPWEEGRALIKGQCNLKPESNKGVFFLLQDIF